MNLTKTKTHHPIFTAFQWYLVCSVYSDVENRAKCCRTLKLLVTDPKTVKLTQASFIPRTRHWFTRRGVATFFSVKLSDVHDIYSK